MVRFILVQHDDWYHNYRLMHGDSAIQNLTRLCRDFAYRYGFARRRATSNKLKESDMQAQRFEFARVFWLVYPSTLSDNVINVDETGICYDMPPNHITSESKSAIKSMGCDLCALPANCTSVVQPLDVGVMGPFKAYLRYLWLTEEENVYATAAEKRRAAILRAIKAWDMVDSLTIIKSFQKAIPKSY
ncbi:hypothetical protein ACHHYP_20861 [Achlya hypogyna]|uniref:DDE-1 domain-containing protein n=1 Tax=Achlya hypogyna TaxID=1202772 RepID=A0A1V9Y4V2_ACHHY|nr:hypothetical protein ACHHYP_20861 [Achlya hypogyna]